MQIRVGCEFRYESTWPTPAVMQVQPHQDAEQRVLHEAWQFNPPLDLHAYTDLYGNTCQRVLIPPGGQVLSYDATIEVSGLADEVAPGAVQLSVEDLPDDVLHYTLPSRFCLSDVLSDKACILPGTQYSRSLCVRLPAGYRSSATGCSYGFLCLDGGIPFGALVDL